MTNEEKLEYAKKNYPVGTRFIPLNTNDECIINTGLFAIKYDGNIHEVNNDNSFVTTKHHHFIYDYKFNNWAEIISKPESKEEMTHEEAIEIISELILDTRLSNHINKSLRYVKKQLKQCEVYPEPVEMNVSDRDWVGYRKIVHGTFKDKFIASDYLYDSLHGWDEACPIKQEPLTRDEWYTQRMKGVNLSSKLIAWEEIENEYQAYLKEFKS